MAVEIERKFLVHEDRLILPPTGTMIRQGYLPMADNTLTAARIRILGDQGFLNIKGNNRGATRSEFEYEIPIIEAQEILDTLCSAPAINKTRYELQVGDHYWEIDIFHEENQGLIIAEIELKHENEQFQRPDWLAKEVTEESAYYNANLMKHPYQDW